MTSVLTILAILQDKFERFLRGFYAGFGLVLAIIISMLTVLIFAFFICNIIFSFKENNSIININSFIYFGKPSYINLFASITALAALSSPAIAYYWNARQNERTKINLSYDFLKEWREGKVPNSMSIVYNYFYSDGNKDISNKCVELFQYTRLESNVELKKAIRTLLNYFESIATACHEHHVDDTVIRRYFGNIIINYYKRLRIYIHEVRKEQGIPLDKLDTDPNGVYSDFTRLAKKWTRLRGLTEPK